MPGVCGSSVGGGVSTPPLDHRRALRIVLLWGPRGALFLMKSTWQVYAEAAWGVVFVDQHPEEARVQVMTLSLSLTHTLCLSLTPTHTPSLSFSLSLSHTHSLSLSLSLTLAEAAWGVVFVDQHPEEARVQVATIPRSLARFQGVT